jgi:DNA-binding NtrC family response regulator
MRIAIVGDNEAEALLLQELCAELGHDARFAADTAGCLDVHTEGPPDLVFLSASAFEGRVVALVASMRRCLESTAVVLLTDDAAVRQTVSAIRAGAAVLRRPVEAEHVRRILREVDAEVAAARRRAEALTVPVPVPARDTAEAHFSDVQALLNLIAGVASASAPVLVMGGPGVGAHLVADLLHAYSRRASQPLLKVSCASLTGDRLDSGALFDVVRGGTLLLEEIGDLPDRMQARLLRALDGRLRPFGEARDIDVRVIATTSADLLAAVRVGAFREDLYFRLNTINVVVPACCDQPDEALTLALRLRAVRSDVEAHEPAATQPALGAPVAARRVRASAARTQTQTLAVLEQRALRDALSRTRGNTQAAAELLGIQRRTLYRKLRKHQLIDHGPVRRTAYS